MVNVIEKLTEIRKAFATITTMLRIRTTLTVNMYIIQMKRRTVKQRILVSLIYTQKAFRWKIMQGLWNTPCVRNIGKQAVFNIKIYVPSFNTKVSWSERLLTRQAGRRWQSGRKIWHCKRMSDGCRKPLVFPCFVRYFVV